MVKKEDVVSGVAKGGPIGSGYLPIGPPLAIPLGIGRAPAVCYLFRQSSARTRFARDCMTSVGRTWCFGRARARPGPVFATPLPIGSNPDPPPPIWVQD